MRLAADPHLMAHERDELLAKWGWNQDDEAGVTKDELQQCLVEWNAMFIRIEGPSESFTQVDETEADVVVARRASCFGSTGTSRAAGRRTSRTRASAMPSSCRATRS